MARGGEQSCCRKGNASISIQHIHHIRIGYILSATQTKFSKVGKCASVSIIIDRSCLTWQHWRAEANGHRIFPFLWHRQIDLSENQCAYRSMGKRSEKEVCWIQTQIHANIWNTFSLVFSAPHFRLADDKMSLFIRDLKSPEINIAAEIPHQHIVDFKNMCKLFGSTTNLNAKSVEKYLLMLSQVRSTNGN